MNFNDNKITTVETNAFQHLPKLKWIGLHSNQIRSLPHQIFKNNPELIFIGLHGNKINSITPDFFKNLNKLQRVEFDGQCMKESLGCTSGCSVSQRELDSELPTCYTNCLDNEECAAKAGKLDNFSSEQIKKNLDLIISSGHVATLIEKGYSSLLFEKVYGDLIVLKEGQQESAVPLNQNNAENLSSLEKTVVEKIQENAAVFDDRLNRTVQEVREESLNMAENCVKVKLEVIEGINLFKENTAKALEATKEEVKDLTKTLVLQMENERLQFKLAEAKYTIDKLSMETELKTLKQEIVELKAKQEENEENFEHKVSEILQKKFDEFERKLVEDNRA